MHRTFHVENFIGNIFVYIQKLSGASSLADNCKKGNPTQLTLHVDLWKSIKNTKKAQVSKKNRAEGLPFLESLFNLI